MLHDNHKIACPEAVVGDRQKGVDLLNRRGIRKEEMAPFFPGPFLAAEHFHNLFAPSELQVLSRKPVAIIQIDTLRRPPRPTPFHCLADRE
jgi:hypothetical protein